MDFLTVEGNELLLLSSASVSTMVIGRLGLLGVIGSLLFLLVNCDESLEMRSPENQDKTQEEKELVNITANLT